MTSTYKWCQRSKETYWKGKDKHLKSWHIASCQSQRSIVLRISTLCRCPTTPADPATEQNDPGTTRSIGTASPTPPMAMARHPLWTPFVQADARRREPPPVSSNMAGKSRATNGGFNRKIIEPNWWFSGTPCLTTLGVWLPVALRCAILRRWPAWV